MAKHIEAKGTDHGFVKKMGNIVQIPFSEEQVQKILNLVTQESRKRRSSGNLEGRDGV